MLRDVPQERDPLADTRATESGTNRAKGTAEQLSRRAPGSAYWLIARNENGRFLRLWEVGYDGWQVRESTAGELISVLYGPCMSVERVALDPLPEMVLERTVGLVSLSRERFVDLVLKREQPPA